MLEMLGVICDVELFKMKLLIRLMHISCMN